MTTIKLTVAGHPAMLTTNHAASSYGLAVLVLDGQAYGQGDTLPGGLPARDAVAEASEALRGTPRSEARKWAGLMPLPVGRPVSAAPSRRINVDIDADAYDALQAERAATGETVRAIIRRCVMCGLPERFDHD